MPDVPPVRLWTVGHSNHSMSHFVGLLKQHRIKTVADVRTFPYSKYSAHFSKRTLETALSYSHIGYRFLGEELGGKPSQDEFYDAQGHVLYDQVAASNRFREGLEILLTEASVHRTAILCSEEDPLSCHRHLLVGRAILATYPDIVVSHIRRDGQTQTQDDIDAISRREQLALFDLSVRWRSVKPVRPSGVADNQPSVLAFPTMPCQ